MSTTITGMFDGRRTRVVVEHGRVVEGMYEGVTAAALGAVRAGREVRIPGVWAGEASLADPTAVCATFADVLDPGTARFEGDTAHLLKALGEGGTDGTAA